MRLNTESKLPRLPASALKVSVGGWAGILPIIKSLPTEAELGCDNVLWYISKLNTCSCSGACKHVFFKLTNPILVMLKG